MKDKPSLFSKIIAGEIPAIVEYEDDEYIVIRDIHPVAPVHVLIIPKKEIQTLEDVDPEDSQFHARLLQTARKVAKQLGISANYKLLMNVGRRVQAVHHIHLHLLGGWDQEKSTEELNQSSQGFVSEFPDQ
ncbi:MAG: histidine triad nucleotide-binding protein [Candidatus Pacebacteria bacterium CG_4_10_14_0_8_um_filter_43_12]|nr:MAG: histidine triad nucleotide-binding protein [Candidatus Pacebacteria bacterium CG10_big_fil_rev_8_21_14_0_10_44_11]PIY79643.1 MAG: histidine triad nucleotide-binding protein [Candidatus Pacebacteria bacterium CG_4_10_14_0_8_um_filter_43_12]